jgi:hypothetical protein
MVLTHFATLQRPKFHTGDWLGESLRERFNGEDLRIWFTRGLTGYLPNIIDQKLLTM